MSLQLTWKHQFEFAGFYAAKEQGFYKDVGLDISFIEFGNEINIVNTVIQTEATYGLFYSSIIAEYLNGKPIVFIANYFKQSPLVLVTQKEITTLSQLKGKKIQSLGEGINKLSLFTMLNKFDIYAKDIENFPLTFSLEAFKNKEADALTAFISNEPYVLDTMGIEYNIFDPVAYGITYYDTNLFTTQKEYKNHPKRVKNFKEASSKGWVYALDNKEEIVDLIMKKYNSQNKSKEALLFEANQIEHIMLRKIHKVGSIDLERVKILAEDFIQSGFIKKDSPYLIKDFIINDDKENYQLTQGERTYLDEKSFLTICVNSNWMPMEAVEDNKYIGIAADYWKLFEKKLDVQIDVFKTKSSNESLEAIKNNECDALSLSAPTQKGSQSIRFTDSFLELSLVIVTQIDKNSILDFSLLDGTSIAVVKGYALLDDIVKKHPKIKIVEVASIKEGLDKVTEGEVFGFADSAVAIDYAYKNASFDDFKVSAHFDEKMKLGLGVSKDDKVLFSILQKVIRSIEYEQKQKILKKWFSVKYEAKFDYVLFVQMSVFLCIILVFIVYRHYTIRKLNKELSIRVKEELKKSFDKDKMIFHQSKFVAMGEMMENIAHQWRQPLSGVNSCVLVIDDTLDEAGIKNEILEEKMQEIESLTKYMSNTIDDFKNFFDPKKEKSNIIIEDIIGKTLEVLKGKIEKHQIKVTVDLRGVHECFTHSNELQQVFLAIINNAIDILASNTVPSPNIKIEIKRVKENIFITICDNAGGISEELVEKIFEPYYTTKYKAQGTGLGLYISKVIIEDSLGGELNVKNSFTGACFTIRLNDCSNGSKIK
ncbi:MAG: ABC transporter substrate-binding protein [Sulfurimonas sp.]|nr:ABC transporter substrate-binding protein [Sulfurimonas sp.]PHQ92828.1 MAG: histidine kinase [Sulfurimonas sp.]